MRHGFIRLPESDVHYVEDGAGPPLVLVHGLAASWRWWEPILPDLTRQHRVFAFDLPGFGLTRASRWFSLSTAGRFVCEVMAALGLERTDLIGHSMGGRICMDVAASCPERVRRLVLVSTVGHPFGKPYPLVGWDMLREGWVNVPKYPELAREDARRVRFLELCLATYQILSDDFRDRVARIQAPTKVIWGGRDVLTSPALGRAITAAISNANLEIIEEAGHTPWWDAPETFCKLVLPFLGDRKDGKWAGAEKLSQLVPSDEATRVA